MHMRDWELIACVHGEEFRELHWIESYMTEKGCDRSFVQRVLSFPNFRLERFGMYVSVLFDHAKTEEEHNWIADNTIVMQDQIQSCSQDFFQLLDTPIVRLVNTLAQINWQVFVKPRLHFTVWSRDNRKENSSWFAGQKTFSYWQLNEKNEHARQLWEVFVSWTIPSWRQLALAVNVGGIENVITFHIGLLLFSIFVQIEQAPHFIERWISRTERELSFKIHNGTIWIYLFADVDCWRNGDWQRIVIHPVDLLLGRDRCTTQTLGTRPVEIAFDNRIYNATATLETRTWERSRFPFIKRTRKDVDLEIEGGIPKPGKGENSYDCEDDALMSTGASTLNLDTPWDDLIKEAVENAISSVKRTRLKYGGENWETIAMRVARETGMDVVEN